VQARPNAPPTDPGLPARLAAWPTAETALNHCRPGGPPACPGAPGPRPGRRRQTWTAPYPALDRSLASAGRLPAGPGSPVAQPGLPAAEPPD